MGKILTQEEIDALLSSAKAIERGTQEQADSGAADAVMYNFRRPDRISKEQMRSLHFLHDRFARNVATSMSAYLRSATDVAIVSVEQFTYSEFLMSLPDPTAFYALGIQPLDGLAALELNPSVTFTMIDRMLGGTGRGVPSNRALTDIEQNVIDGVVKLILENLTESWRSIVDVHFRIHSRETRPQMLQVAAPNEVVVLIIFDMKIGDTRGMVNFCIPATIIEAVGASFAQGWYRTRRSPTAAERSHLFENIRRIPVVLTAALETRMKAQELLVLRPGDTVSLGHPLCEPINIHVGKVAKFTGFMTRTEHGIAFNTQSRIDDNGANAAGNGG